MAEREAFAKVIEGTKERGTFLVVSTGNDHFCFARFNCRPPANHKRNKINAAFESAVADRVKPLLDALNSLACWNEGPVVTGSFDEPDSARIARKALSDFKEASDVSKSG